MASFNIDNFKIEYYHEQEDKETGWPEQFHVEEIYHCGEPVFTFLTEILGMDVGDMDRICFEIFKGKTNAQEND